MTVENEHLYRHIVFGDCHAIGFKPRGPNDDHVCWTILTEDDEYWFVSTDTFSSSYWLIEMPDLCSRALEWLKAHCNPDPSGCGWMFR